jgi:hypothetical protein
MPYRRNLWIRSQRNGIYRPPGWFGFAFLSRFSRCRTNTVPAISLCPTSDSHIHRMYF